ncbi:DUF397 domain-containing protein [Amycolatopsis sp. H20-H5]|uniref:DUF397 domain-containing protein n=1 Tax=Amycolatopsis sp. H20-H5 TaxID=3046309 RepID=UPI002DBA7E87|nr:DUF397 domain-containing protein [Amycolatopsis sp. H20-H5]MEC3976736.1 DUF397 domain-containing protein [Amycolatopsis sp. H20-H5]
MAAFELTWIKSTHSDGYEESACVEVALTPQLTAVRDSKAPTAGNLTLPHPAWTALLTTVRSL